MSIISIDEDIVHVPQWVSDHDSFRRWADADDFPEEGRVFFLRGEVWVDMSKEQAFSHNQLKTEYCYGLVGITKQQRDGRFFSDGIMLTHVAVGFLLNPDGVYVSNESFETRRVRLVEGAREGYVELEGAADMVLEVVSDSSVRKDNEILLEDYYRAGVGECWLVDARGNRLAFAIFRRGPEAFETADDEDGWLHSEVLSKSFRLARSVDQVGNPDFTLEIK